MVCSVREQQRAQLGWEARADVKPLKAFHVTAAALHDSGGGVQAALLKQAGTLLWLRVHEDICQLFFTVCWHTAWDVIWTRVAETLLMLSAVTSNSWQAGGSDSCLQPQTCPLFSA